MIDDSALTTLCDRLFELLGSGRRLSVVAAVCETGADPKLVRAAFEHLQAQGSARLVGGDNRGWSLVRQETN